MPRAGGAKEPVPEVNGLRREDGRVAMSDVGIVRRVFSRFPVSDKNVRAFQHAVERAGDAQKNPTCLTRSGHYPPATYFLEPDQITVRTDPSVAGCHGDAHKSEAGRHGQFIEISAILLHCLAELDFAVP
jgi:hypothetical protein